MSYADLLRDPRWQRKRLEVMNRDGFACRKCGDQTTTLNVHHTYYTRGAAPWEYPAESLQTLCENCHEMVGWIQDGIRVQLGALGLDFTSAVECVLLKLAALKGIGDETTVRLELVVRRDRAGNVDGTLRELP